MRVQKCTVLQEDRRQAGLISTETGIECVGSTSCLQEIRKSGPSCFFAFLF